MPGVRIGRLLASTAVALLLTTFATITSAEPATDTAAHATPADGANIASPAATDTDKSTESPSKSGEVPQTPPADASAPPAGPAARAPSDGTASPVSAPPVGQLTPKPEGNDATSSPAATAPGAAPSAAAAEPAAKPDVNEAAGPQSAPEPATAAEGGPPSTPTPAAAAESAAKPDANTAVSSPSAPSPATPTESAAKPPASGTAGTPSLPTAATTADTTSAADAAIAEQLRELSHGKFDHIIGNRKDRGAIDAFYSKRNYTPVWLTDGKPNPRAQAAITYLGHVDADGLDPADYPVPDFAASTDPAALAEAELKLTTSVITYAHHAAVGRVHWSRISADIEYHDAVPDPAEVLAKLLATNDVAAALNSYEPHASQYLALKAKLAQLRAGRGDAGNKMPIAHGPVLKVGAQDRRVPQLRERLGVLSDGDMTYDKAVADAVKRFQQAHELKPTGMLTAATVEALNGRQPEHPIDIVLANMERWRWMPHDLGKTYVIVNLPDYTLRVMHDGKQVWMTKIVIGKPSMPTPIMTAEMKYITINPTWNVPPSIVNNEYLPALQQDPTALERIGLVVSRNPDGTIRIYQPPGDRNALGRIRFNFPNKFLVYQHDTPDKYMFANDKRAFSHGCMRVLNPPKYAEVLLSLVRPQDGYTVERIEKMYGPEEKNIEFPTFVPVHLTYQTAFVDDAGKLEFRDDIYGRDKALLAWLKGTGEERKVADIPVEHRENINHRQILAMPDSPTLFGGRNFFGNGRFDDGRNFFSRLFGGAFAAAPPQPVPHRYR